jgi:hypothetical protein
LEERRRSGEGGDYDILGGDDLTDEDYALAILADFSNDQWLRKMVWESIGDYGIRDWSREPYGAGVHLWGPGAKSWEVRELFAVDGAVRCMNTRTIVAVLFALSRLSKDELKMTRPAEFDCAALRVDFSNNCY